jgi:hypothetical protein
MTTGTEPTVSSKELLPFWNKAAREKLRAVGQDRMSTEAWQICESLLNRIDQLEANDQQPVAWRCKNGFGDWHVTVAKPHPTHMVDWEPLYVRPAHETRAVVDGVRSNERGTHDK